MKNTKKVCYEEIYKELFAFEKDIPDFNDGWRKHLEEIVNNQYDQKRLKRLVENKVENKEGSKDFLNTNLEELDYHMSDSFFTKKFQKELTNLLDAETFLKKSTYEQKKIQEELSVLNEVEYEWKGRLKGPNSEYSVIIDLFKEPFEKFEASLEYFLNPSKEDLKPERANRNFFKYKAKAFVEGITQTLIEENNLLILEGLKKLTDSDYDKIIKKYISKRSIFVDVVKVILKKANDNLFNNDTRSRGYKSILLERSFVVEKTTVFYEFRRVFALYVLTCVFCYVEENKIIENFEASLFVEKTRNFLIRKRDKYDKQSNKWWVNDLSSCVSTVFILLEQSKLFLDVVNEIVFRNKTSIKRKKYVLPTKMEDLSIRYTELPRVVTPGEITDEELDIALKPALFGENRVSKSQHLKNVLTVSQKKRFGINEYFVNILSSLLNPSHNLERMLLKNIKKIELPFLLPSQIETIREELKEYIEYSSISSINKIFAEEIHTKLVGVNVKNISYSQILNLCGVSDLEKKLASSLNVLRQKLRNEILKRKLAQTNIVLGDIYKGIPIYITNTFCVRLRLYPKQPFISRTSGSYKHILCEYTPVKITLRGLINLLKCIYIASNQYIEEFDAFLMKVSLSKMKGMTLLFDFFKTHKIDFLALNDNFIYVSMLYSEILIVIKTGKTRVMLEVDQKASGSVFLALALRNKKLAQKSNIISRQKSCPYTYCMSKFEEFYNMHMTKRDVDALDFLSTNRKLHKYAKMCYTYSQSSTGRREDFLERWSSEQKTTLKESTKDVLFEFANKYDQFIEFVYPGINKQIKTLLKLVKLAVKETGDMTLRNMNGEILRWRRFKHVSIVRSCCHPISKAIQKYRVETTEIVKDKEVDDVKDHQRKFLSYFIHSIDAAVMHHFILEMRKKEKYTINHLHDCVLLHPNYIDSFYVIVEDLYKSDKLYNLAFYSLFDHVKNNVSNSSAEKIKEIMEEFIAQCDDFADELKHCEPRNIYQPES